MRINAEDPFNDFRPSPGRIDLFYAPGGHGIRWDSHVYSGYSVPPFYDSMIGKLIAFGSDRATAMDRLSRALDEFIIRGIKTTVPIGQAILKDPDFRRGTLQHALREGFLKRARRSCPREESDGITEGAEWGKFFDRING